MHNTAAHPMQDQLASVLADVRSRLQDKLLWMIGEIEALKKDMTDPSRHHCAVDEIRNIAHKISGVAGSVGFNDLGQAAARVDKNFSALVAKGAAARPDAILLEELEVLLDHMEYAIDQ